MSHHSPCREAQLIPLRLNSWLPGKPKDATTDPEKLREADEEVAEFKKAMNANRAATGACLLFP